MNRIQYPPVYAGLYVLLMSAVTAVVNVQISGAASRGAILFWAILYGTGLTAGWKFNQNRSELFKKVTDVLASLAFFFFVVALFSSGFDKAFLLLLIGIQAARNFTLATRRDFYYSYVISLILILYAASLSKETLFIVTILIYVLAGMFTLMADHIDDTLSRAQGGDREVLIRRMSLPVKGAGLAVVVTVLSVLIYLLVPRPASPHVQAFPSGGGWTYNNSEWERQAREDEKQRPGKPDRAVPSSRVHDSDDVQPESRSKGGADYSGFQQRFDITKKGACSLDDGIVFFLRADEPLHVRVKTFDAFDGRAWTVSNGSGRQLLNDRGFTIDGHFDGSGTGQTFSVEADLTAYIPCAYRPVKVWFPGGVISQEDDMALRAPGFLRKGTVFSVLSDVGELNGRPYSTGENSGNLQKYLQLPDNLSQRVKELGSAVALNMQGSLAKAESIEQYLKTNYFYTSDTLLKHPDSDVIDKFLFEQKQGHCEYFATSMVIMLRTINVPARLATGYAAYRENAVTGYYEVRRKNAHAWVEAYIEGYGWMTFEPTSTFVIPRGNKRIIAASGVLSFLEDRLSTAVRTNTGTWWAEAIRSIVDFLKRLWIMLKKFFRALVHAGDYIYIWFAKGGWRVFLALLAAAVIAYFITMWIAGVSDRVDLERLRKKDERQFIIQCYSEMEKIFAGKKLPRAPFCAPSEYASLVAERLPHLIPSVEVITSIFNRARYSAVAIETRDADNVFDAYQHILKYIEEKKFENEILLTKNGDERI